MTKISLLTLLIAFCYLSFCGCWDVTVNHQLKVANNLNVDISTLQTNGIGDRLTENNLAYFTSVQNVIEPDSSRDIIMLGNSNAWHEYIEQGKSKKLSIYIFLTDSLRKYNGLYPMDDLVRRNKYFRLLIYSEEELDKINWNITVR